MSDPSQQPPSDPYRPQDPYQPQQPYGHQPPPGQPPSAPPGQGRPPYGPPVYGQPYVSPLPPKHSSATTAMVLGIVALAGGVMCYLPILLGPVAWVMGARAVREIDASGGALGGRSEANAGKITGIIATVLLALALIAIVVLIIIVVATESSGSDYDSYALFRALV